MRRAGSFRVLNWIRQNDMKTVVAVLILLYCSISVFFGVFYFYSGSLSRLPVEQAQTMGHPSENSESQLLNSAEEKGDESKWKSGDPNLVDCIYYSFITAATTGFGDVVPVTKCGKTVTVIQSVISALYIAVMMAIITSKLLWARTNTLLFSEKVIVTDKNFKIRIINTNSMRIINPEIRFCLKFHGEGDTLVPFYKLDLPETTIPYFGRHDISISFGGKARMITEELSEYDLIWQNLKEAIQYQRENNKKDSRFRIVVTVSGSNGIQNIAEMKKYYATDFVAGSEFREIKYGGKDTNKYGIKYSRIKNFKKQFESIMDESALQL